ncbi:MAG TPA: serine hydrolase [Candidatus Binatia bacterium]|jgi:beta-lactamase class A|nr:serine hydrolase [Candidatus Binatia bacterium]
MRSARWTTLVAGGCLALSLLGGGLGACADGGPPSAAAARDYLSRVEESPWLQALLDRTVATLQAKDARLRASDVRIAVLDLRDDTTPKLAQQRGYRPMYPASVIKFVYLMAAYAFQETGQLRIDPELDGLLTHMIFESSNQATQGVVARITGTTPGPALAPEAYAEFRDRRLSVNRWLGTLGVRGLHCVNPTFDGTADMTGRDRQLIADRSAASGLAPDKNEPNRNAMTAVGTAELLALLATDRALSPADSATVRRRMRRDPKVQRHLAARIAGGASRLPGLEVYAKTGTWGPIYADAGIVRNAEGKQFVVAVLIQGSPAYRGDFIADLTERLAAALLAPPAHGTPPVDDIHP